MEPQRISDDLVVEIAPAQQRLWLLNRLDPQSSAYNIAFEVAFSGALDIEAMRVAVGDLTDRHLVLRTVFLVRPESRRVADPGCDRDSGDSDRGCVRGLRGCVSGFGCGGFRPGDRYASSLDPRLRQRRRPPHDRGCPSQSPWTAFRSRRSSRTSSRRTTLAPLGVRRSGLRPLSTTATIPLGTEPFSVIPRIHRAWQGDSWNSGPTHSPVLIRLLRFPWTDPAGRTNRRRLGT